MWGEHRWLIKLKVALRSPGRESRHLFPTAHQLILLCCIFVRMNPLLPSWSSALGAEWGQLARSCKLFTFTFYLTSTFGGAGPISICGQRPELIFSEPSGHNLQHLPHPYPIFLPTLFICLYLSSKKRDSYCPIQGEIKAMIWVIKGDEQSEMLMKPLHVASGAWIMDAGIIQLFSGTAGAKTKGSSTSLVSLVCSIVTLMHIFTNIHCVPRPLCHLFGAWERRPEER